MVGVAVFFQMVLLPKEHTTAKADSGLLGEDLVIDRGKPCLQDMQPALLLMLFSLIPDFTDNLFCLSDLGCQFLFLKR